AGVTGLLLRPLLRSAGGLRHLVVAVLPARVLGAVARLRAAALVLRILVGPSGGPVGGLLLRQLRLAPALRARGLPQQLLLSRSGVREPQFRRGQPLAA